MQMYEVPAPTNAYAYYICIIYVYVNVYNIFSVNSVIIYIFTTQTMYYNIILCTDRMY